MGIFGGPLLSLPQCSSLLFVPNILNACTPEDWLMGAQESGGQGSNRGDIPGGNPVC